MKYKEIQKASELKKGDYVSDMPLDFDNCSIFIFDHFRNEHPYFTPCYNCNEYEKTGDFIGFFNDFPSFKISKQTANQYIKNHEEKI